MAPKKITLWKNVKKLCFEKKSEHQVFSKKSCIEEKFEKIRKLENRKNKNSIKKDKIREPRDIFL